MGRERKEEEGGGRRRTWEKCAFINGNTRSIRVLTSISSESTEILNSVSVGLAPPSAGPPPSSGIRLQQQILANWVFFKKNLKISYAVSYAVEVEDRFSDSKTKMQMRIGLKET